MATTRTTTTGNPFSSRFAHLDLGNVTLPTRDDLREAIPVDTDRLLAVLRDAAYVVVGLGVLTVQQVQSRTRDLLGSVESNPKVQQMGIDRTQIEEIVSNWETQFASLDERFEVLEAQLDTAFEKIEDRLPDQAANVLGQAHDMAKAARKQVRGLLRAV
jgi:Cu/Ag efflux pump CusA